MTSINHQTLSTILTFAQSSMILSFSVVMALHSLTSNYLAATISSSFFFPAIYDALLIFFSHFGLFICFRHLSLRLSPSPLLDYVSSYSKYSSAFNSLCLYLQIFLLLIHAYLLRILIRQLSSQSIFNYVPVRSMIQ